MYIAACSFLTEHSANTPIPPIPGTRDASPRHETSTPLRPGTSKTARQHAILADSTSANYTTCYKTLQQLRVYWAGVDYVLEALNQRAGGLCNESSFDHTNTDMPENLLPFGGNRIRSESLRRLPQLEARMDHAPSPAAPLVAFTIVGTTDSSKLELTCMYPGQSRDAASSKSTASAPTPQGNMVYDPIRHPHSPPPPRYPQAASPWEYDWSMPQNDQSGPPGQATPIYTSGSEQSPVNEPVHDACSPKSGDRQPTSSSDNHSYSLSSTGSAEADATRNGGGGPKNDYGVYSALPSAINNQDSQVMSAQFPMVPGRLPEMITTSTELPLDDLPLSEVQLMDIFLPAEELGLWPWQNDASQM